MVEKSDSKKKVCFSNIPRELVTGFKYELLTPNSLGERAIQSFTLFLQKPYIFGYLNLLTTNLVELGTIKKNVAIYTF